VLAPKTDILKIITEFYGFRSSVSAAAKEMGSEVDLGNLEQFVKMKAVTEIEATDKHIVNAVEFLFRYAFDQRASDIHIEPKRDHSRSGSGSTACSTRSIRCRNRCIRLSSRALRCFPHGHCREAPAQDGRIKTEYKGREVEFRVSTMPVAFGEKVVLRIFDPDIILQDLEELDSRRGVRAVPFLHRAAPRIILVTGPTAAARQRRYIQPSRPFRLPK